MKTTLFLSAVLLAAPLSADSSSDRYAGERPPVTVVEPRGAAGGSTPDPGQRLYAPAPTLVSPDQAREIVGRFRSAYERLGRPRLVIAVNRELVDASGGLRLSARKERVEGRRTEVEGDLSPAAPGSNAQTQVNVMIGGASGPGVPPAPVMAGEGKIRSEKITAENSYEAKSGRATTLADRQTVRDLERLVGRPLRAGGAVLADQRIVAQLIEDKPVDHFLAGADETARKDRDALALTADAVVEILISSRALVTPGLTGDETYNVPDLQATIVRLKDGAVLAQASSRDVLGKDRFAGSLARTYDVNEIAEATALALMEDLAATVP